MLYFLYYTFTICQPINIIINNKPKHILFELLVIHEIRKTKNIKILSNSDILPKFKNPTSVFQYPHNVKSTDILYGNWQASLYYVNAQQIVTSTVYCKILHIYLHMLEYTKDKSI